MPLPVASSRSSPWSSPSSPILAFTAGDIGSRNLGSRTRVYTEGGADVLDAGVREFAGAEEMAAAGERQFGPYKWEREMEGVRGCRRALPLASVCFFAFVHCPLGAR